MSILPQALTDAVGRISRQLRDGLLPSSCLLCGGDAPVPILCPACTADLPLLPAPRCPHCAEPTTHGERCGRCLADPPHFDATVALYRYDFPMDRLVHALKYGHQLAVAGWCGGRLADALAGRPVDRVLALPLHRDRLRQRGFNQSAEIARSLGRHLGMPVDGTSLHRSRATAPQAELALKERAGNVRCAFECGADLSGQRLLLIDDVMTSGATLREAARVLKLHGAAAVTAAVVARAVKN